MHLLFAPNQIKSYFLIYKVEIRFGGCVEICLFSRSVGCARAASETRAEENACRSSRQGAPALVGAPHIAMYTVGGFDTALCTMYALCN